ncbi:uncharacterized protein I206_103394 [Kwoniella pini CBS 10737]|uniref:Uncharacterized protein n=1 Tax=Kwoniella pini CBS 10737 TaxID=1296096 RepID=A0A1B9IA05_9TREE|nr:uncharacterized protein I206_01602 [Kwoniella pini CBS 10737]OCF52313.1 hypothetical protein I206_01602 [Kwoniella pini CBS 10737]
MIHQCLEHIDADFISHICHCIVQIPWSSCFPSSNFRNRPKSPDLEAQEGELETLLSGSNAGWDDSDMFSLSTPRAVKERQAKGLDPSKPMINPFKSHSTKADPPAYESHLNPSYSYSNPSSYPQRPVSGYSEFEIEIDEDAKSLSINPTKLAEIAKQFEPTLTLDDIRREEEEQAERDREAERVNGPSMRKDYARTGSCSRIGRINQDQDEEFGEFEEGKSNDAESESR